MTRASGIQLHGGWVIVLMLALATSPPHADTLSYGYDANGNRISGDGQYYEYNDANRLVRIRQGNASGPILAEFFYDHTGQRIKKIENGVTTYYIGKHFEANQQGYGTVNTNYYFAGTERVAKKENTGPLSFYHANHLGSTEAISDANGNLVNRTNYFPFGEIRQGGAEKYSFTGKERDAVSGQYYFEARYYASSFKHFTQADTIVPDAYNPQNLNRYSYVVNNPITNIDPTGHVWWKPWTWNRQQAREKIQFVAQKGREKIQFVAKQSKSLSSYVYGNVIPTIISEVQNKTIEQSLNTTAESSLMYAAQEGILTPKTAGKLIGKTSYVGPAVDLVSISYQNYSDAVNPEKSLLETSARFSMDITVAALLSFGTAGTALSVSYNINRDQIQQNIMHNPVIDAFGSGIYWAGNKLNIYD